MKNLITILFLISFGTCFAQTIDIVVFSEAGDNFTLYVNSIKQNEEPRANVKAKDLNGENFSLRIEFMDGSIPTLTKNIWTENKDIELTAIIKQNKKGKYVLRYMGETPKNPDTDIYSEESYVVYEDPEEDNNVTDESTSTTSETITTTTTVTTDHVEGDNIDMNETVSMNISAGEDGMSVDVVAGEDNVSMDISVSENGMDVSTGTDEENINMSISMNASGTGTEVTESSTTTTTTVTTSSSVSSSDEIYGESMEIDNEIVYDQPTTRCSYAMTSSEFKEASESVESKTFDDDKLLIAKQICQSNCMTSEQIRDMNKIFSFEDNRLEFAKFAYDYVYDISDYYKVYDSFDFEMTIEELNEYLENR